MTQPHTRSATFDPADYRVEGIFDNHEGMSGWTYLDESVEGASSGWHLNATEAFEAETQALWADFKGCAHCGKRGGFIIDCYVRHVPSGELLYFGSGCVADAFADSKVALKVRQAGKAAAIRKARDEWTAANPEQAAALDEYEADVEAGGEVDSFLDDLSRARRLYGALTVGQTPWPVKALAKRAEWVAKRAAQAAALAQAPELAEGRYEVEGTVVSVKWVDSDFGGNLKMLVELADGNRVFGTVPSSLDAEAGDRVAFTAQVERSKGDEHFGYYKRPTKARKISGEEG